jgi:Zn-dependent protease with chaperone function
MRFKSGPKRFSIFISNYLIDNLTPEETGAVLAHELAHAKRRHVAKTVIVILAVVLSSIDLLLLNKLNQFSLELSAGLVTSALIILFGGIMLLLTVLQRRFEREADRIAVYTIKDGEPLASALRKLNAVNLIPSGQKRNLFQSHPPIETRIRKILEFSEQQVTSSRSN